MIDTQPEDVFRQLLKLMCEPGRRRQIQLFADDARWDFPLAGEEQPRHLNGKEQIVEAMGPRWDAADRAGVGISIVAVNVHRMMDPTSIFAEFSLSVTAAGSTSIRNFGQFLKVENGLITELREYGLS